MIVPDGYSHGFEDAIDCYDRATELEPDYVEAWNNRGLAHIETYPRTKLLFGIGIPRGIAPSSRLEEAVRCFYKAIEYGRRANFSKDILADIYNNLGVAYYELTENEKAQESFDTALELDSDFELAKHNKSLTIQKIGK